MAYHFFAMVSRMKYIDRWALMRNTRQENLTEHSHEVAVIAHALAVLRNRRFGGHVDAARAALLGLYHDLPETLTGDLPTPVKYHNPEIRAAYQAVENSACSKLTSMLPEDLRPDYEPFFFPAQVDAPLWPLVKAADKISALAQCMEEEKAGNREFIRAKSALLASIHAMRLPEAECFLAEFLPGYALTLDELE